MDNPPLDAGRLKDSSYQPRGGCAAIGTVVAFCRLELAVAAHGYRADEGGNAMAKCDVCGNDYDKSFQVMMRDRTYTFDCFECAVHALAPVCAHCGCRIIGHGVEAGGSMYCCAHCASHMGVAGVRDRVS